MGECELCGLRTDDLRRTKVESTVMSLCSSCSGHGKVFKAPQSKQYSISKAVEDERVLKDNYHVLIKQAREKQKLTIQELARKISEKESVLHNVETKHLRPNMVLAQKLEKYFHISLYEKLMQVETNTAEQKGEPLTMGDVLKSAMKKK